MASGLQHLLVGGVLAFSFFAGAVLVDLDHVKTHNIKQLYNGFIGKEYKDAVRDDGGHFFHREYKAIFLVIGSLTAFGIGLFIHLKMDGVI